ncbi:MAG: M28 family peptidase [Gammaproteobacteria bacterium]|nr:M28 family peptidase [Gammaproteobacteria bacterium]
MRAPFALQRRYIGLAAIIALNAGLLGACSSSANTLPLTAVAPDFNGRLAWQYTRKAVSFGPRPPGSQAHARLLEWLKNELDGIDWETQRFTATTPGGAIPMTNLIARFPGTERGVIVIGGHYDTLSNRPDFVGANDGGSSTGMLLALAKHFAAHPPEGPSVWLVWFDGEEAMRKWVGNDHTYGSRALVRQWQTDGTLARIRAVLVLDMIGDRHLNVAYSSTSTPWLMALVCRQARRIGAGATFCNYTKAIEDDDAPFRAAGVPAAVLIDFRYGLLNEYWHTSEDTMNKLSPESFRVVGAVVLATLHVLAGIPPESRDEAPETQEGHVPERSDRT